VDDSVGEGDEVDDGSFDDVAGVEGVDEGEESADVPASAPQPAISTKAMAADGSRHTVLKFKFCICVSPSPGFEQNNVRASAAREGRERAK
jgi:hypothetical protein